MVYLYWIKDQTSKTRLAKSPKPIYTRRSNPSSDEETPQMSKDPNEQNPMTPMYTPVSPRNNPNRDDNLGPSARQT